MFLKETSFQCVVDISFIFNMELLLIFGIFVVTATAHNITFLDVPQYGDPRQEAKLVCQYISDEDDPPLHSVKWYSGINEIFRFTPDQEPPTRTFKSTSALITNGTCNKKSCAIGVILPKIYNTILTFTCEVSTEGPRFAVVKQTKNLTVAVALTKDPVITGIPDSVQLGEEVSLNCTTQAAMPPANIVWFIDGIPYEETLKIEPWMVNNTQVSTANNFGLRSSWRYLRLRVTTLNGYISLRCEATQPTFPPYKRSTYKTLNIARSPHLSNLLAAGTRSSTTSQVLVLMTTLSISAHFLFLFVKLCALNDVL